LPSGSEIRAGRTFYGVVVVAVVAADGGVAGEEVALSPDLTTEAAGSMMTARTGATTLGHDTASLILGAGDLVDEIDDGSSKSLSGDFRVDCRVF
jgi:hypothetical protein